eukprot:CAMPEP_0170771926 /NCGR_PEP_ID=MMETSP0733-20121128/8357_1 /TAXON_ID=186038 /ORGANISM="Fragilariopsis kerguelensis, Strain L26-C5" /LENGTH=393 /DNA_ID=CAMNT_0011113793 /DNA_START=169 /DNA_END=1350 /DNA_ORIENTATION=+
MMNLVSACIFTVAFLCDSASAARGVGFNTKLMSEKPSKSKIIDQILPNLKDTLGISKFRFYNAVEDAPYVADLISGNRDTKLIVDVGFIWYRDSEQIKLYDLTSDDVSRYLTDYIDEVGETVKAALGDEYEWLDNVGTVGYCNEPFFEYYNWGKDKFKTLEEFGHVYKRLNGMVQDFFNTYKKGKYSTTITIAPIMSAVVAPNFTMSLAAEALKLQAEAGAPTGVYANLYSCPPGALGGTLPFTYLSKCVGNGNVSTLADDVVKWRGLIQDVISSEGVPVDPTNVKLTVTESGYPTSGEPFCSEYLSAMWYASTIRQMEDPDSPLYGVDVYFFEALDEDLKPEPWDWGIMTADGKIKEQIAKYWPKPDDGHQMDHMSNPEPLHHSNNLEAEEK